MTTPVDPLKNATQEAIWNFFSPDAPTLFAGYTLYSYVIPDGVREQLDLALSSLTDETGEEHPVALWFKHQDRGDDSRSSTSRFHAVLFLRDGKLVACHLPELPTATRSSVLETLGVFFLQENLCEEIYDLAEFDIMHSLDVVHFKEFTLLVGEPVYSRNRDFHDKREELGFDEETLGLKACVHSSSSRENREKQNPNIERAMELIHKTGLG